MGIIDQSVRFFMITVAQTNSNWTKFQSIFWANLQSGNFKSAIPKQYNLHVYAYIASYLNGHLTLFTVTYLKISSKFLNIILFVSNNQLLSLLRRKLFQVVFPVQKKLWKALFKKKNESISCDFYLSMIYWFSNDLLAVKIRLPQ